MWAHTAMHAADISPSPPLAPMLSPSVEAHYQTTIFDMKSTLEERIKRADDISKAYKHFRLEVAKSAEHSKTGRPISDRLLAQLEQEGESPSTVHWRVRAGVCVGGLRPLHKPGLVQQPNSLSQPLTHIG